VPAFSARWRAVSRAGQASSDLARSLACGPSVALGISARRSLAADAVS
jgi:hypothetical protein